MNTKLFSKSPECEIVSTRVLKNPQELVFRTWTEPEHLKNWWGPAGFSNTFTTFDLRPGGRWCFIMHGPEKGNYHNECEFIAIEKPKLIAWQRHSKPLFKVLATFEALSANSTQLVFKMLFDTVEECNKLKPYVLDKNEENFDRLETELSKMH